MFKIVIIFNKYNNILNNLMNSSNIEFLNKPKFNKRLYNIFKPKSAPINIELNLEKDFLDKNRKIKKTKKSYQKNKIR